MENKIDYHVPVMLKPCLDGLNIHPDGTYIDVTFGGGGHSRAIFDVLSEKGRLIVFDQDPDAKKNAWEAPNFFFVASNFSFISNHLRMMGIKHVDGILADLGVSSHQFDEAERGFSIRANAPLDMRMNQAGELTAKTVVNTYDERELSRIFKSYGEIPNARKVAGEIVRLRSSRPIKTTTELMDGLSKCAPRQKEHKFFAQVFQALRIEVNQELDVLERFLEQTTDIIAPGGRLVVMSYHSLEDRLVKNFMKKGSLEGEITKDFYGNVIKPFDEVVRHPIVPDEIEIASNPRARSAKLRIGQRR
ncbi:MAG: 16S rRNA (cytosine(1402)-N(4))-methyltransferase RsmH [Crocinitomicaceae bacterium]|jgi:16S rRNA (cytosine1402-N4)-methyltransferase|nr:16S rRNA (cytosine(1402)-N(4))-methyltransferase RsmH [Crocinitomicaceae bacterium]MDP5010187.1 16S rRNA (cytosine(1402)-N(4))-methyltransferase RsmH [Crocinitomicaceae bacterium]MDP5099382.1 16S rRNA (cytosine(1402)-N(4))-methyltransferase RsmH [Crocinitomicaceae bacterium]